MKKISVFWLAISIIFTTVSTAEEVCKFTYKGQPENLHDSTVIVQEEMVTMSEYVYVGAPKGSTPVQVSRPAILVVIDNSPSMSTGGNDQWGNRFRVTRGLIDTLYARFPKAEIGVAAFRQYLFFDPADDNNNELMQCPQQDTGAYLPFYRLDSTYAQSGQMGYEILKKWLETDTVAGAYPYVDLTYIPSNIAVQGNRTNINAGFDAAKHAMLASHYGKECHYVIFISDGTATHPPGSADAYVQGTGVPTTFTIFFTGGTTPPQELVDFTANVRTNGYSATNPNSKLWAFQNTEYDTLMKFIMDSIVSVVQQTQISYPTDIEINGVSPGNPWDSTGFAFSDLFPLIGRTTPFVYNIDYHIFVDSITETGDTIIIEKDTATHITFTVEIQDGAPDLPDTFEVKCWDRELGFYHNNSQVNLVDETMNPLELRFIYNEGEAQYNYTRAEIEVVAAASGDRETYSLTKNGTTFSSTFPIGVINSNVNPSPGNTTLEAYIADTFVATFRNSEDTKLVLDTLQITVPFELTGSVDIKCGYYFDNNADGFVDSIFVEVTDDIVGGLTDAIAKELIDSAISLPAFRNFTINNSGAVTGGFYIEVTEGNDEPTTFVTANDKLVVSDYMLSIGGIIKAKEAPIYDRVAPIIHWEDKSAYLTDFLVDSISDTLTVKFSEPVNTVTASGPFFFLSMEENKQYPVQLAPVTHNLDSMKFYVVSFSDVSSMRDGDSIWIQGTDRVSDALGNNQNNSSNTRRKLWVERRLVPYDLNPNSVSPIDITNLHINIIPQDIINVLINQGVFNDLNLQNNTNGNYIGMIITIVPDPVNIDEFIPDFKLKADISIFDAVGNQIVLKNRMAWWDEKKSLVYVWNIKNKNNRTVGPGMYLSLIEIEEITASLGFQSGGPKQTKKLFVGVRE